MEEGIRYAGFWRRLGAYLLDLLIIVFSMLIIGVLLAVPVAASNNETIAGISMLLIYAMVIFFNLGYHPFFLVKNGTTPGKDILGLVVIDNDLNSPLSLKTALLREFVGRSIIDRITFGLGDLLIIFDSQKQALHDKIGGTYVVFRGSLPPKKEKK